MNIKKNHRLLLILIAVDCLMVALHLFFGKHLDLFNLDRERNFPTYWSGTQLLAIAMVACLGFLLSTKKSNKVYWGLFCLFFLYLQFDEISELHENITYYISTYIKPSRFFASPTYMWVVFFSPLIIAASVFLFKFTRIFQKQVYERRLFIMGVIAMITGGVLIEALSGLFIFIADKFILTAVEEGMEKIGVSMVFVSVLGIVQYLFNARFTEEKQP